MKLVCAQSDLNSNLSLVSRAVPSRPTHPILANVLLVADAQTNQVSLTAFDLSLGIRTSFNAEVLEGGVVALPSKLLNDITSRLPEGDITLDDEKAIKDGISEEGLIVTLTPKSGSYKLRAMGGEDFPELPVIENAQTVYLTAAALIEGLRGTLFATSADETKQVLTGVHITLKQDTIEFAATDGHRLAVVETENERSTHEDDLSTSLQVTVPAKALRELERMLGSSASEEENIALSIEQGQIIFALPNQRLTSRTLEGQYPAYHQLIPRKFERQLTLDRKKLVSCLERTAVFADQNNNIVKISIDGENENITLSVESKDVGSGKESMPAEISGEDIDIAFNVKYLMDGLKALPCTEIQMHLNTALAPVIFTPIGGIKMTYLAMPVQLRN
jgi:DNA polymerase III subunit beta